MSAIALPAELAELLSLAISTLKNIITDPDQSPRERRLAAAVALQHVSRWAAKSGPPDVPTPPRERDTTSHDAPDATPSPATSSLVQAARAHALSLITGSPCDSAPSLMPPLAVRSASPAARLATRAGLATPASG